MEIRHRRNFMDGCFDGFHYGHVHALFQAKMMSDRLIVATHTDEEMEGHKNAPVFPFSHRLAMLQHCRYVDDVVPEGVPYVCTKEVVVRHGCTGYLHAEEHVVTKHNIDALAEFRHSDMYRTFPLTRGISTTRLLMRAFDVAQGREAQKHADVVYLENILQKMRAGMRRSSDESKRRVVLWSCWDMVTDAHMAELVRLKQGVLAGCAVVAGIRQDGEQSKRWLFNQIERAIIMCGIRHVDDVILEGERCDGWKEMEVDVDNADWVRHLEKTSVLMQHKFDGIRKEQELAKEMHARYLDTGLYGEIVRQQMETVAHFLRNTTKQDGDIIVLDIDEVCLVNLMYQNDFVHASAYVDAGGGVFNFRTGLNPFLKEFLPVLREIKSQQWNYAFVTGRRENLRQLTLHNLEMVGLGGHVGLHMCDDAYTGTAATFKQACRSAIQAKYNIVCTIGDQIGDIVGENTGTPFLIFNPFYKTE